MARALQHRMIGSVTHQLQAEISLDRRADVRRPAVVNRPAAVFILMAKNVVNAFLVSLRITGAEQRVHQDVIGLKSGIGFEFAAPVAVLVLLRKQAITARANRRSYTASEVLDFSETQLWR